jgi:hypothetical protein
LAAASAGCEARSAEQPADDHAFVGQFLFFSIPLSRKHLQSLEGYRAVLFE